MHSYPATATEMNSLLEVILKNLRKFSARHEIHVTVLDIIHSLLSEEVARDIIIPCYNHAFQCLFAIQHLDRISIFEQAAAVFDFSDCINVIESKLSDMETLKDDLVTTIEFISYLVGDFFFW
jgi:hypothetical protein